MFKHSWFSDYEICRWWSPDSLSSAAIVWRFCFYLHITIEWFLVKIWFCVIVLQSHRITILGWLGWIGFNFIFRFLIRNYFIDDDRGIYCVDSMMSPICLHSYIFAILTSRTLYYSCHLCSCNLMDWLLLFTILPPDQIRKSICF